MDGQVNRAAPWTAKPTLRQLVGPAGVSNHMAILARLLIGFLLCCGAAVARADEPAKAPDPVAAEKEAVRADPTRDSFIILPLHVHLLQCKSEEDLDCKLSDADVHRVLAKVNGVWHRAGIHWRLASLAHEDACNLDLFHQVTTKATELKRRVPLEVFAAIAPPESRKLPGLHVYYIHQFSVNGVYLGGQTCFVKDTASLRRVEGGIDEPLPRVTSHELGHSIGLPHRQDTFNLMASGTTGTLLSRAEVEIAREHAKHVAGAMTVKECESAIASKEVGPAKESEIKSMKDALDGLPNEQR